MLGHAAGQDVSGLEGAAPHGWLLRSSREYSLFFLFNGVGLGIALTCLAVSHYLLGFRSALADDVAANVVGLVLGTAVHFWSYRRFVFVEPTGVPERDDEPTGVLAGVAGSAHE
ncbi:MAG TPA: GtrA family protein [Actinomycetes bacterium]|nr:GtrA family protein [Actinomycetes bacterium]